MTQFTGASLLADLLVRWDCGPIFHVPGEGMLELLAALADHSGEPRLISCRQEGGMAYMAQASGHVRGKPGICIAGRAPGALNAALALHTAWTDAAPMILIVGQAHGKQAGREAFLDNADFRQTFDAMARWVGLCTSADRLPEMLSRAWAAALTGQRGPVVLVVNEDVWHEPASASGLMPPSIPAPCLTSADAEALVPLLRAARQPLLIAGGTGWSPAGSAALADMSGRLGLPVMTSYRRRDLMPSSSPVFAGELGIGADPVLLRAVEEADLVIVAGMRLGEINTFGATAFEGFKLLAAPQPLQTLVHIHPDMRELNRVYQAHMAICAQGESLAPALGAALAGVELPDWSAWRNRLRSAREAFTTGKTCPGPLDMREICTILRRQLPADAMLTVGAGAYAHWPQRYFAHEQPGTQLGPKSGAMGYALSAAIGVQAACPGRRVVAMAGDGCFMMHGEELATAVLHGLPITMIIVNNSRYGAIGAAQMRQFGKVTGVDLAPIDFVAYAQALGAAGIRVERTEAFAPALDVAAGAAGPVVIELITGPEALRP